MPDDLDPSDLNQALEAALSGELTVPESPTREHIPASSIDLTDLDPDRLPTGYVEPWTRRPEENDHAWELFVYFRDLGPARTVAAVAEHFSIHDSSVRRHFVGPHDWRARVAAWDTHVDRVYRLRLQTAIREMADRHAEKLVEGIEVLTLPFAAIRQRVAEDPDFLDTLSALDIRRLFDLALQAGKTLPTLMTAERLARGMPTEIVRADGEVRHVHELRDPDHIAEILAILDRNNAFPRRSLPAPVGEIDDAEIVSVHDDLPVDSPGESEAVGLPPAD